MVHSVSCLYLRRSFLFAVQVFMLFSLDPFLRPQRAVQRAPSQRGFYQPSQINTLHPLVLDDPNAMLVSHYDLKHIYLSPTDHVEFLALM